MFMWGKEDANASRRPSGRGRAHRRWARGKASGISSAPCQHRAQPSRPEAMSLHSVRAFLAERAPDIEILEASTSTATVALAAAAHGVEPARIAKTLTLRLDGNVVLLVMSGTARLDNRRY